MVKATVAPKVRYPKLVFVPFAYAVTLAVLAVVQLMGVGGFDFAHIAYQTPGTPGMIMLIAGLEIFSIPFLVRMTLSPLARACSAIFSVAASLFILGNTVDLIDQKVIALNWYELIGGIILVVVAVKSFTILDGAKALRFSKK